MTPTHQQNPMDPTNESAGRIPQGIPLGHARGDPPGDTSGAPAGESSREIVLEVTRWRSPLGDALGRSTLGIPWEIPLEDRLKRRRQPRRQKQKILSSFGSLERRLAVKPCKIDLVGKTLH